ncbi:hypothetical protein M378DRAFT_19325 [Amanita muscaria Koide BX008]|uniref:Uncharacterized protein n=1 Tax=Amanita muscaria (strain Koide BX008) TaxID=946122 RepID=A0A0C2RUT3_AMAMK|nr:hypothetical protein M378DRAFT_19325 [Amanita muscaria Koide BX008]
MLVIPQYTEFRRMDEFSALPLVYVVVERDRVIPSSDHLDDIQAAAWPVGIMDQTSKHLKHGGSVVRYGM